MFRIHHITFLVLLAGMFVLTSCAGHEGLKAGLYKSVVIPASPIVEKVQVSVTPAPSDPQPTSLDYLVGIGDVLSVMVYARPDLSTGWTGSVGTVGGMSGGAGGAKGSRVDGEGNIHLPLIGSVAAAGMTVRVIREKVETALLKYLKEPSVVVEVAEYRSKPIYLMGQFRTPGVYYLDRPMTFLQGITLGNGFDAAANLRGVRLLRDQKIAAVDVYSLILEGRIEQNVWLRPGDTVFIPDNRTQNVFVFGAVNKPGPLPMPQGRMNILEAIASSDPRPVGLDLKNVRIIRSLTTTTGELLVVDVAMMRRGEALPMQLIEGDVVYVPKNTFGTWNDTMNEILPSLLAISNLLQPFVSIKFLMEK